MNRSYNPQHSSIESHLDSLSKSIDSLSSKYDKEYDMEDSPMKTFVQNYKLQNLIKESTCFKNSENPTCIDLILTKKPLSFKNIYVIVTGLSDFQKMIIAVMKMHFPKIKPQVLS